MSQPAIVRRPPHWLLVPALVALASPAFATSFTVNSGTTNTTAQTLGTASGQTGTVEAGGTLSVSSSTVAVTISGNNATLTNLGTMLQTSTGANAARLIRDNTGVTGLVVNNGSVSNSTALMQAADADVFQMNKATASVTLNNYGILSSLNASKGGAQAVDFSAITTGSNIINNFATGQLLAIDADAVRPGVNGVVNNWGTIKSTVTTDTGSDGVDAQNDTGVSVVNNGGGTIIGARHGITGGAKDNATLLTTTVSNLAGATIQGNNGSGINLDGFNALQTATITNGGLIVGNGVTGDGDGIDVDGVVNITNTGIIRSLNSVSATTPGQSEGITVGGGTITNSGTIEGLVAAGNANAVGRGITLAGVDTSGTPEPMYAASVITNQAGGLIRGQSDSAIAVDGARSGFTVTINNNSGATLRGGGVLNAAVRTGADDDTLVNGGLIDGSSSGKAVDLGAGNNTLRIVGGSASILGDVSGGVGGTNVMTINPGSGQAFAYAGSISNFSSVQVQSGQVTLSSASTYTGSTVVSGGLLTLNGANRLAAGSALDLDGGELQLTGAAGPNGQTFASLSLTGNSMLDLGSSSLSFDSLGAVTSGKTLTILDWVAAASPDYALRIRGDLSGNSAFQSLLAAITINGAAAGFRFDGTYTDISAVPLPGAAVLLVSGLGLIGGIGRRGRRGSALAAA